MRVVVAVAFAIALTSAAGRAQHAKPITGETAMAFQSWVGDVRSHAPGRADAPVTRIAALSYRDREELNAGMGLFLAALLGEGYDTERNPAAKWIVDVAHGAGNPTALAFLKQAAVFHADVAAYGDRTPVPEATRAGSVRKDEEEFRSGTGRTTLERKDAVPGLLLRDRLVTAHDGEVLGDIAASWNWPFARFLLDLVAAAHAETPAPGTDHRLRSTDSFVSDWYHATNAYMLASGAYGDLTAQLEHAARLLPNDARVLFDRACYAELFGLPMHQALISEREIARQRSTANAPRWAQQGPGPLLRIPPAERTNADAERLFRRTIEVDPEFVEARVRLARLLQLRNRHRQAAEELNMALAGNPDGVTAFYTHLFAGRSAQALGDDDEAAEHYRDALRIFPDAQSALLASSQLALARSDVPGALAPIERLGPRSGEFTADPWWQYHLGSGRDSDQLLRALWASVPAAR